MGLRKFVTAGRAVAHSQRPEALAKQRRCRHSTRVAVLSRGMTAQRVDIDAVKQQVKLLGRQFDHSLLTTGPNEAVRLEPFHEKPESGPVIEQKLHAIAFAVVECEDGSRKRI